MIEQVHRTEQALLAETFYDGPLDRSRATAMLREAIRFFSRELPPPPSGLPGRNFAPDQQALELLELGWDYARAVAEGRTGRQWTLHNEAAVLLEAAFNDGRKAEAAGSYTARLEEWRAAEAASTAREKKAVVYFIAAREGPVKIGKAADAAKRLAALQTAHASRLELLAVAPGGYEAERAYHQRFAAHRLNGEWFTRCPEIEAEIARLQEAVA